MSIDIPLSTEVPHQYKCPISLAIMRNPVICSDGSTYEREEIERWLAGHSTSPATGKPLTSKKLIPNSALMSLIRKFVYEHTPRSIDSNPSIVRVTAPRRIQLFVRVPNEKTFIVCVYQNDTVRLLRDEIERVGGIKYHRLIYRGKQMALCKRLRDYSVVADDTILVALRTMGGA